MDYGLVEIISLLLMTLGVKLQFRFESRVVVAEARRQFGNQDESERTPMEAVTRGLVKR
jgi:hypothetical protein